MSDFNTVEITAKIKSLFILKNIPHSEEKLAIWANQLKDFPPEIIDQACKKIYEHADRLDIDCKYIEDKCKEILMRISFKYNANGQRQIEEFKYCKHCKRDAPHTPLYAPLSFETKQYWFCKICGCEFDKERETKINFNLGSFIKKVEL